MKRHFISLMKFSLIAFSLVGMVIIVGCNGDEEPEVDPVIGDFKLSSATYLGLFNPADGSTAEVAMTINPIGEIPVNSPISDLVAGVLNGVPECLGSDGTTPDPSQVQVEFRDDNTLWITCDGEGEQQSGTWSKNDETTVTLSISPTDAIPAGLTLVLSNVAATESNLSGRIDGFPVPKDLTVALGAQLDDGTTNIQLISATVTLARQ